MSDQPNRMRTHRAGQNAARLQSRYQPGCGHSAGQPEDYDIGLNRIQIDGHTFNVRKRLRQPARIGTRQLEVLGRSRGGCLEVKRLARRTAALKHAFDGNFEVGEAARDFGQNAVDIEHFEPEIIGR